jgi:hypothetical protein
VLFQNRPRAVFLVGAHTKKIISPTAFSSDNFFYLCSLHIGSRQGAALLELGDLEAVASPRGSPQTTGRANPDIASVNFPILSEHRRLF